ncbi:MAG TPA: class I SAM-dependent methyltransferase [Solirubrobacteraceae bacterium]|jgi:SAM-dependent methyltransferase
MVVTSTDVVWHDLECGAYSADLPLWLMLADRSRDGDRPARVLDVGAGTGRVSLDLVRAGHDVTALDLDPDLLGALRERAAGPPVQTVRGDARSFELDRRNFDLCLVPMQTLQLLRGSNERIAFMRCAHAHLRSDGLLACAIVLELDPFDCAAGGAGPAPETAWIGETLFSSRATRVSVLERAIVIERERRIAGPTAEPQLERNLVELDRVSVFALEREAIAAGLRPVTHREIAPTDDHVGSKVVMFRA